MAATAVWIEGRGDGPHNDVPTPRPCAIGPEKFETIQVSRVNRIAIMGWLQSRRSTCRAVVVRGGGIALQCPSEDRPRQALIGDWIVLSVTGEVYIAPPKLFRKLFVLGGPK